MIFRMERDVTAPIFTHALCRFSLRTEVKGGYNYHDVTHEAWGASIRAAVPPAVGDIVSVNGYGCCEVIARQWMYPVVGSMVWPSERELRIPEALLEIILVESEGVYRNEGSYPTEDDEEGDLT